ncbi:DNA (cytosine-5-)-methyltransferase [Salinicola sp. MH3R3-1]|uniref:DNA cytosine methyltransferase n=1 Tax=Salinicola sp. MH3R3-1 TaxID=1928762 RepID=UPI00094F2566|nr:DNA cytosine methyltransferase [Salinicola sp. MH3R3-1]OLO07439.1 DNA (cytosine-5-)-methyltransferase [Salinicola sp. MH3R3-1]
MDKSASTLRFVDVFSGCGGLSLGLLQAGCRGVFAIEKSPLAFETFRYNLVDGDNFQFEWPEWLPKEAMSCEDLLQNYSEDLAGLRGSIDVVVGGPPCQGFSTAGRRDFSDPRNQMTNQYLLLIDILQPRYLVIENVAGINMRFSSEDDVSSLIQEAKPPSHADSVDKCLEEIGYSVSRGLVNCSDYGVPQNRLRYLFLCERDVQGEKGNENLLRELLHSRNEFLSENNLPLHEKVTAKEALHDLCTSGRDLVDSTDSNAKGFKEAKYTPPPIKIGYLKIMREMSGDKSPNSRRLANHKNRTIEHFKKVQKVCRPGRPMSKDERERLGVKKHTTTVLHPDLPAPTVTTLPDDILHYFEPRILTVRENARLQSFPDWFSFQGKYTTGGKYRKNECPRYTQVGNAVPPLLSKAIGTMLLSREQKKMINIDSDMRHSALS